MSHRMNEPTRMAALIVGTLALGIVLCLALAGVVDLALAIAPPIAPEIGVIAGIAALAAGYFGFTFMVKRLFRNTYG